jgi:hypothetical protein
VLTSRYFWQIETFLEHFPKEQIHVVESERLSEEPAAVVEEVLRFADISLAWDPEVLTKRFNVSTRKKRRSLVERKLEERIESPHLRKALHVIARPFRRSFERPSLSAADRAGLVREIGADAERLRSFSGLAFSRWTL